MSRGRSLTEVERYAPKMDFQANESYVARVKKPFHCPAYTKPYPDGKRVYIRTDAGWKQVVYTAGEEVTIVSSNYAMGYQSGLVQPDGHWINTWTIFDSNKRMRIPGGIAFCELRPQQRQPVFSQAASSSSARP